MEIYHYRYPCGTEIRRFVPNQEEPPVTIRTSSGTVLTLVDKEAELNQWKEEVKLQREYRRKVRERLLKRQEEIVDQELLDRLDNLPSLDEEKRQLVLAHPHTSKFLYENHDEFGEDCNEVHQPPYRCRRDCFTSEQEMEWAAKDLLDTMFEEMEDLATEDLEDDELEDEFIEMDTEDLPISHLIRCTSIRA